MRLILLSYYFVLLPVWVALIVVMMSAKLDPLDTWLGVPFGLTLLTAGIHLAYFRREHVQLTRRISPRMSLYTYKQGLGPICGERI